MIPTLGLFIIFCIWVRYESHKNTASSDMDSLWAREAAADCVRKQNIDHLDYIVIDTGRLPFSDDAAGQTKNFQDIILSLTHEKILNLTQYSNTELKEKYGPANLDTLSNCDANYIKLVSTLSRWGEQLFNEHKDDAARMVFEYSIDIGSDVKKDYILLAKIYQKINLPEKIYHLIELSENLHTLTKEATKKDLLKIYESFS